MIGIPWWLLGAAFTLPALAKSGRRGGDSVGRDVLPDSPLPGLWPMQRPQAPSPSRALAARLVVDLLTSPPGSEDHDLVRQFQAQEGLKASGFYNSQCAEVLADRYGLVPPQPRFWNRQGRARARAALALRYREHAANDTQRREEWLAAARLLED